MKKILILILFLFIITGCKKEVNVATSDKLTIYALNDFHGNVIDDKGGLSRIGNYLIDQKKDTPNQTVIVASGDMLQGSAISNMTQGKVVLDVMSYIGFDAMTIGNHEFDWGIDTIASLSEYASFPFLAANIYDRSTNERVNWAAPYTTFMKGELKVGVIGIIGKALTEDISPAIISGFEFKDEVPIVKEYARKLRVEEKCDIVILSAHNNTQKDNQIYADMGGDEQIDAVFNGHTHSNYHGETLGADGIRMPYVQSASTGQYIGKVELTIDNKKVVDGSATNIRVSKVLANESVEINNIINEYNEDVQDIINEVLGVAGTSINRTQATYWSVDVIKYYTNKDIAIINTGGIRSNAFPIDIDQGVTVGKVWEIMPFDNIVKTVDMKARDVVGVVPAGIQISSNAKVISGNLYIDGNLIAPETVVSVATIDYLFDNTSYGFLDGTNQVNTGILFRDLLINYIREVCSNGDKFNANTLYD